MIKTLSTDSNNDLFVNPNGSIAVSNDIDAVLNICEHVAKTMRGELVLQGDVGMPYFEAVWSGVPNIPQAESALRRAWLGVDGVKGVDDLTVFVQDNVLYYNATIQTIYGEAAIGL